MAILRLWSSAASGFVLEEPTKRDAMLLAASKARRVPVFRMRHLPVGPGAGEGRAGKVYGGLLSAPVYNGARHEVNRYRPATQRVGGRLRLDRGGLEALAGVHEHLVETRALGQRRQQHRIRRRDVTARDDEIGDH